MLVSIEMNFFIILITTSAEIMWEERTFTGAWCLRCCCCWLVGYLGEMNTFQSIVFLTAFVPFVPIEMKGKASDEWPMTLYTPLRKLVRHFLSLFCWLMILWPRFINWSDSECKYLVSHFMVKHHALGPEIAWNIFVKYFWRCGCYSFGFVKSIFLVLYLNSVIK